MASTLRFFGFWVSGLALGVGVLCSLYVAGESLFLERTAKFSEGMETCLGRLRQGHLLAVSGARGAAGEDAFFKETESCFSELVFYMEQHLPASLVRVLAPINKLVIDVHRFHKDLSRSREEGFRSFAREKLGRLEGARRGIVERLQDERNRRIGRMEAARMGLVIAWGVVMALLVLHWVMARKRREGSAEKPMGGASRESLRSQDGAERRMPGGHWNPKRRLPAGLRATAPPCEVLLGESVGRVLGSLADEIFSRGIRVEPDIGEDVWVRSRDGPLMRVLEVILSDALRSLGEGGRLKIFQQYRGKRVVLSLGPLGADGLKNQRGGILSGLVGECGGTIEDSPPGWVRLSFVGEALGPKRVFKGKKKDILRQLSSMERGA